jgi:DNA-binding transcriptional regulator YbjK
VKARRPIAAPVRPKRLASRSRQASSAAAPPLVHSEKGEKKRREVLEATLRLLAREGPRAVTHRAVAAEAGTSVRGTTYYFASREALLEAALRHYAELTIARFDAIGGGLGEGPDDALELAATLLTASVESDLADPAFGLVAELELILEIARRRALEPTYQAWQARLEGLLEIHARRLGSDRPALDARLVLATLRGLEMEALAHPSVPVERARVREVFERLLRAIGTLHRS